MTYIKQRKIRNLEYNTNVAHVQRHDDRPPSGLCIYLTNMGDNEFLTFINGKIEWE
jgi:sugar/nucleoside kinase (ribokinase family)